MRGIFSKALKTAAASLSAAALSVTALSAYYYKTLPDSLYTTGCTAPVFHSFGVSVEESERQCQLRLFGFIPIKEVEVTAVDRPVLIPGGNPFGILIRSEGVLVVSLGEVDSEQGLICPAADAGIKKGDLLLEIDGEEIRSNSDIARKISRAPDGAEVLLRRDGEEFTVELTPAYSCGAGEYKAGMYVRDSCAGIGTVTFYDPESGGFGGLGHPVCDSDTGLAVTISDGESVGVSVTGVVRGEKNSPGELCGSFTGGRTGSLLKNSSCGLFGKADKLPAAAAIPMALRQEVHRGAAEILVTAEGSEPQSYGIEIEKVDYRGGGTKNMVIRITDEELLKKTGGIVQGMSGSPIIQDGQLAGAVTHVFLGDPTRGYGIFCETMLDELMS